MSKKYQIETALIRTQVEPVGQREHGSAIYMTSSFTFNNAEQARALFANEEDGNIYSRYGNPNTNVFVEKLCLLEGAEAGIATASGMAAMFGVLAGLLNQGDHVLAAKSLFSSTSQVLTKIFPRWGITHTFADVSRPETWPDLIRPETKLCVVETPSNPALDLIDLTWLGNLCRENDIIFVVDNVFATPILQKPIEHGANIVMHSATKFIDGQGSGMGGVIVGDKFYIDDITFFTRQTGPALSPFNAWLFNKSLETLPIRIAKHCENALQLATFLESHPQVEFVRYPYLPSHPQHELAKRQMKAGGGVVTFVVKGGVDHGRRFLDSLQMCSLTANLGDSRTIATHPASTTHSSLTEEARQAVGILPGLIRVSVGLEHIDDIIADIDQAL